MSQAAKNVEGLAEVFLGKGLLGLQAVDEKLLVPRPGDLRQPPERLVASPFVQPDRGGERLKSADR